ncbi:MAG: hypothetical protein O3B31_07360 [Chloroflexi bacterium]|nr:hypothetical protein [Chloroflexota bacterium]
MHVRVAPILAIVLAVLLGALLVPGPPEVGAAPGEIQGDVPAAGGAAAVVWGGGDAEALAAAAAELGCDLRSVWTFLAGRPVGFLVGAPSFVNATFLTVFPSSEMPASTIAILRCEAVAAAPRPSATPSATNTPAPAPATWAPPTSLQQPTVAERDAAIPAYARSSWDHWVDADGDCQDARQEVLIAESRIVVSFETSALCRVLAGEWLDQYTGQVLADPGDLDVDHLVPLQNAHLSGGWAWSSSQRRDYANDLTDPDHLIAVTAAANRSKGARGPEEWRPPLAAYWCRYAVDWIEIKDRWLLSVTSAEWSSLLIMLATCPSGAPAVVPSISPTPTPTVSATPTSTPATSCDPSYPDVCIPPAPPDLDCGDISHRNFRVVGSDPHRFDGDNDGVGCES